MIKSYCGERGCLSWFVTVGQGGGHHVERCDECAREGGPLTDDHEAFVDALLTVAEDVAQNGVPEELEEHICKYITDRNLDNQHPRRGNDETSHYKAVM